MKTGMVWTAHLPAQKRYLTSPAGNEAHLHRMAGGHIHRPDPKKGNREAVQHVDAAQAHDHVVPLVE
jgi:hypothetical protein